jgi:hypothetical protein
MLIPTRALRRLYWLYKVARNFESFTTCSPNNGGKASFLVPTGWRQALMVELPQRIDMPETPPKPPLPFAVVLQRIRTKQLVIILRRTSTSYEWLLGVPPIMLHCMLYTRSAHPC